MLQGMPSVIAHRGASNDAPENTLAALELAKSMGAEWVEFDVQMTATGELVVFHDTRVERTTDGQGKVGRLPLDVLRRLDAGGWFAPRFSNERVPLLSEWLKKARELSLGLNLEIKSCFLKERIVVERVYHAIETYWPEKTSPELLISSFSYRVLQACYRQSRKVPLGWVVNKLPYRWQLKLQQCECVSMHLNVDRVTPEVISVVNEAGYDVLVFTVDDAQQAWKLLGDGVTAVFSNKASLLVK